MTDLDRIREMEEIFGVKLKRVKPEDIWTKDFYTENPFKYRYHRRKHRIFPKGARKFCVDVKGNVTGLALDSLPVSALPAGFLQNFEKISALSMRKCGAFNFNSLACFKKLLKLDLSQNYLVEMDFLENMTSLTELDLSSTQTADISVLSSIKTLKALSLSNNFLAEAPFLNDLTGLDTLFLENNFLKEISFLERLKKLTVLHLRGNELTDVSSLKELKRLTTLGLMNNKLTDISSLAGLKELTSLDLMGNLLTDVSALKEMQKLTSLDLGNNKFLNFKFLKELSRLTSINLCDNELTNVSFLAELKGLTSLNLDDNIQLDVSSLKGLKKLTSLTLRRTHLEDFSFFQELEGLKVLDFSYSSLRQVRFLKKLRGLTSLNLGYNFLRDILALKELTGLSMLDLGENQIEKASFLKEFKNMNVLNLSGNELIDVTFIKELTRLSELELRTLGLADVSWLKGLKRLACLDLTNNRPTDLSLLKELKELTSLNLSNNKQIEFSISKELKGLICLGLNSNQLNDVSSLRELRGLTYLELSNNQLNDVSSLRELKGLTGLDLNNNQLKDISSLRELKGLTRLGLGNNKLKDVSSLRELRGLTRLELGNNKLKDVSSLRELKRLKLLELSNNQLKDVSSLRELKGLTWLELSNNQLEDVSFIKELKGLTSLYLRNNRISVLPEWITNLNMEIYSIDENRMRTESIILYGNPIKTPPIEVVAKGKEAIKDYYRQIREQGEEILYESKVLIVGEPGAGKSTLFKKLQNPKLLLPKTTSTLGVEIKEGHELAHPDKKNIKLKANLWDFGGQEIQYQLHQYFITPDALYIIVADNRAQNTRWDYWLQIISLLGGRCPVLVVLNDKKAASAGTDFKRDKCRENFSTLTIDEAFVDFGKNDSRWTGLQTEIKRKLAALPLVNKPVPRLWKELRVQLAADKRNYIPIDTFFEMGRAVGLTKENDARGALEYFHDIGIALHFAADENLRDIVFLKPNWITRGLYAVLDKKNKGIKDGKFTKKWIEEYWENHQDKYSYQDRTYLLRLMLKDNFDICYPLGNNEYIVPMRLPETEPVYKWDPGNNLHFRYRYPFMPEGILSRLIVRLYDYIHDGIVWKNGVIFVSKAKDCKAEVLQKSDTRTGLKYIGIRVSGNNLNAKKDLLYKIREQVEHIHRTAFSNIVFDELVECNCSLKLSASEPHFFTLDSISKAVGKGRRDIQCHESTEDVSITELIGAVYLDKEVRQKTTVRKEEVYETEHESSPKFNRPARIFISYSKKDKGLKDKLIEHLATLTSRGDIVLYHDTMFKGGSDWKANIDKYLRECDVVLFLVSAAFLDTNFIMNSEVKPALQRKKKGEPVEICPVILGKCSWEDTGLRRFNALTEKDRPISKIRNKDEAFYGVVKKLKDLLGLR